MAVRFMEGSGNSSFTALDNGNLVLRDEKNRSADSYVWQSFDYPSDTFLPGMKLGTNFRTGLTRKLTSWRNYDDPSLGDVTYVLFFHGYPEPRIQKGESIISRRGPWNGITFSGGPVLKKNSVFTPRLISNDEEIYYMYENNDKSMVSRLVVNQSANSLQIYTWKNDSRIWKLLASDPRDRCDTYRACGAFSRCNMNTSPGCPCLMGFMPESKATDWTGDCIRKTTLNCSKDDGFVKIEGLKMPDTSHTWVNGSMSLKECKNMCLSNCSCTGYTVSNIRDGGSGCAVWFGDLVDIRDFPESEQPLYVRVAASDLEDDGKKIKKSLVAIITPIVVSAILLLVFSGYYTWTCKMKLKGSQRRDEAKYQDGSEDEHNLPIFDLATISKATDNFSISNKLGEGGFGPVYKGELLGGQEIAVKRLSKYSTQGADEFKNEVILISNLQHRNLVKLLGCCIQGEENMLIYEYMPNKSLDSFIFDTETSGVLDWKKRFDIIIGIARGLLYLHHDSRMRIIHRDLKASNVLLDNNMSPKISDFGLARMFREELIEATTSRVVGTYGYMSPEYVIDGHFSLKSDVFSFGVLLLEIISGKKNKGFVHPEHQHNLLGHAWKLWIEGKAMELIEKSIEESFDKIEIIRCIHVGLLCVQQHPDDRPTMSKVVLMLSSESHAGPQPKEPGFFTERYTREATSLDVSGNQCSTPPNDSTSLLLVGR